MKIKFLYFDGCPNVDSAYLRLQTAVDNLVPGTPIEKVEISSEEHARNNGFYGSPSIHLNGVDLEQDEARVPAMTSRIYENEGAPPEWLIEAGILRALQPRGFLFLCVANSARSQLGEAIARKLAPPNVLVQSAGSRPTSLRPEAAAVLSEWGIDTSRHRSKNVSEIDPATVDTVITLCAEEECPVFLGKAHRLHWGLPDPARVQGDEERLNAFRAIRDELQRRLTVVFTSITEEH